MYSEIFKKVVEASQKNNLTFFVGAGVSKLSNAPKWSELIDSLCAELGHGKKDYYSSEDYLRIPQMYYYSVNENLDRYYSFVDKCFDCSNLQPNLVHKMLFDLSPSSFITTNFDDLLEKSSIQNCLSYKSIACDKEVSEIHGDKYILKIHGDLQHRNIVLKEEDYLNYSENFKLIETLLKSIFSTNTVVMIGYGLNDYNIKLIINWAKSLLKDRFNKPIFIYTDDEKLSQEELLYHESRGLSVIEYYNCDGYDEIEGDKKFENRYVSVLKAINHSASYSIEGKTKEELFNVLFALLEPLDQMRALKPQDIQKRLFPYAIVEQDGTIMPNPNETNILEHFIEINKMDHAQICALPEEEIEKYRVILSVLSKGRILQYRIQDSYQKINGINYDFANLMCLSFDYCRMNEFVKKDYSDLDNNYFKAYYFAKLQKYKESYEQFTKVAAEAFKNRNYLLYYLAQVNRKNIFQILKNINSQFMYQNYYDLNSIETMSLTDSQAERIFENLPHEFQRTYECFKDLNSINLLYKNSYDSFIDGRKLQNALDKNTFEMGLTSSDKVICRINNNLHFLLGNGLYVDEYSEFKNTIKNLMELLVYKYSFQNRAASYNSIFPNMNQSRIHFDYIDFYCFVEYFESKELVDLFSKHNIQEIEFVNCEQVYSSIINLINYYDRILSKSTEAVEKLPYQHKIKACLIMLRHMKISQEVMDRFCKFIFKYEFREIYINDKILFLDYQISQKNMFSNITSKVVEDKLISYFDQHIDTLNKGEMFELPSTSNGINYYNLIHYIKPKNTSRRLSIRITKMLKAGLKKSYLTFFENYYPYLSPSQQKNIVRAIKQHLNNTFDFECFSFLVCNKIKVEMKYVDALKEHLEKCLNQKPEKSAIQVFPRQDEDSDLVQIGYWCLLRILPRRKFKKYVGHSDHFDFYYLYDKFDFEKFDISWLFNLYPNTYQTITRDETVKRKLCSIIANRINDKNLNPSDEKSLTNILIAYFC